VTPTLTLTEPERKIPVACDVDVCVVGGSCTGVFAAVRAARLGARVAVIEQHNCFGGMATAGNVNVWHSLNDTSGRRAIIAGLTREVLERLQRRGAAAPVGSAWTLNTEELKIELDELVMEHRVVPFLRTFYAAPATEDGLLKAVIVESKSGRRAVRARQFVDATGDGDVALDLGLPSVQPERPQPPSLGAKILGLDGLGGFDWLAAVREHGREFGLEKDWGWGLPIPGLPGVQFRADTHVFGCDPSDGDQLTRGEIEGRRQVRAILDVIRTYGPADRPVALADLAAALGARESRRLAARYRLTGEDVLYGKRFDDAIANGSYRVDIHHADGPGITFRNLDGTEEVIGERGASARRGRWRDPLPEDPTFYQVPFRCLLPGRVPNLVLAGRMLDADDTAYSAVRVMVNLNQTGEAAGVACALALDGGGHAADADPRRLRARLAEGGSLVI